MDGERIIVIGTGVFGVSAAEHIHKKWPEVSLTVVSCPSPLAPSDDISKIVRIDYNNAARMEEAIEAQRLWKADTSFSSFYHDIGRIAAYPEEHKSTLDAINGSRAQFGLEPRKFIGHDIMKETFDSPSQAEPLTYVHIEDDAIVDWKHCMDRARERVRQACIDSGGHFHDARAKILEHDNHRITSIRLEDGQTISADDAQVVLAVGPWFAELLETSNIPLPPTERIPVATGIFAYYLQLTDSQAEYCRGRPMYTQSGKAEFMPPAGNECVAKISYADPFTNYKHESSISFVEDLSESALARKLMREALDWARKIFPFLQGAKLVSTTSYWDGVTASQIPLIDRHPQIRNLIAAVGGSYNRAKDLPSIGRTIVDVLCDRSIPDRYTWNPRITASHGDHPMLVGKANFASLEEQAMRDQSTLANDSTNDGTEI